MDEEILTLSKPPTLNTRRCRYAIPEVDRTQLDGRVTVGFAEMVLDVARGTGLVVEMLLNNQEDGTVGDGRPYFNDHDRDVLSRMAVANLENLSEAAEDLIGWAGRMASNAAADEAGSRA